MGAPGLQGTRFEVVGRSYLWGLDSGCLCISTFGHDWVSSGSCDDDDYGCYDIPNFSSKYYNRVNNMELCARRETALNSRDMPDPTRNSAN